MIPTAWARRRVGGKEADSEFIVDMFNPIQIADPDRGCINVIERGTNECEFLVVSEKPWIFEWMNGSTGLTMSASSSMIHRLTLRHPRREA